MFKYNGPGSPPQRMAFVQIPEGGKEGSEKKAQSPWGRSRAAGAPI